MAVDDEGPGHRTRRPGPRLPALLAGTERAAAGERRSGLGLTIVRQIAEAHGGEVEVGLRARRGLDVRHLVAGPGRLGSDRATDGGAVELRQRAVDVPAGGVPGGAPGSDRGLSFALRGDPYGRPQITVRLLRRRKPYVTTPWDAQPGPVPPRRRRPLDRAVRGPDGRDPPGPSGLGLDAGPRTGASGGTCRLRPRRSSTPASGTAAARHSRLDQPLDALRPAARRSWAHRRPRRVPPPFPPFGGFGPPWSAGSVPPTPPPAVPEPAGSLAPRAEGWLVAGAIVAAAALLDRRLPRP